MDDSDASPISESEVLEGSVASAAGGGSGAYRSYGSTVAKQRQPMESKTPGSARKVQESDEPWPAHKVWELSTSVGQPLVASGGFGADFTQKSLLAQYRPDLLHLPTTKGEHCTGDAIKMGEAIGEKTIDLGWVQVHPTGLVRPDNPDAKFLAALRGVDGLDTLRNRFVGKAGLRDRRDAEKPFRLAASDEIARHYKHCTERGVMKLYESGAALSQDMGVPVSKMEDSIEAHYQASLKTDPDGGPYPASPSGKLWDEASGKTGSGEKFYHNVISGADFTAQPYFVTPVIYCRSGLEIDEQFWVRIPSQFAAVEVAGSVQPMGR